MRTSDNKGKNNPAYTHGHAQGKASPEYQSWACMMQRCTNPNVEAYRYYGGRGIRVCKRWHTFTNFLADMGNRPAGTSLDRKDNDKNYCKSNCRWADRVTQARNSAQVVWVCMGGKRKRLVEWCEELGVSINTVRDRVKYYNHTYQSALTK